MAPRRRTSAAFVIEEDYDSNQDDTQHAKSQMQFSQVVPDRSQTIDVARDAEIRKLENMEPAARQRIVTDLSRILLFKGLNGDVIDRKKVVAEALGDMKGERVQLAMLNEAEARLRNVFGFSVRKITEKMEVNLPGKFKDRLYLINDVTDDEVGTHSINIHAAHEDTSIEKGVLMIILAFAFCKGSPARTGTMKGAGKTTRWITEHQLYSLMNRVDENIPSEPPSQEGRKKATSGRGRPSLGPDEGLAQTPDVDALLEKFVQLDYLLRDKIEESETGREASEDGKVIAYAMGPRAAMEIGRKQIVWFCSNILDEQPDPTMLAEIDEDEASSEEEAEPESVEEEPVQKKRSKRER
ncbi:hypothetical protein HJC23_000284 [Cyclotella cryptica]|uniref:MAGE domain-containing protein n=1 Tax=Cyclotella cryptica TaxID=29204 RepID=A0ABD3QBL3_9STRA|eukprot:CCRYP_006862-RA/>CCRYP_006862-RA protein AED:0.18 eAED:0.18 QI:0/-1/0/1/-1/1/1/0/353